MRDHHDRYPYSSACSGYRLLFPDPGGAQEAIQFVNSLYHALEGWRSLSLKLFF